VTRGGLKEVARVGAVLVAGLLLVAAYRLHQAPQPASLTGPHGAGAGAFPRVRDEDVREKPWERATPVRSVRVKRSFPRVDNEPDMAEWPEHSWMLEDARRLETIPAPPMPDTQRVGDYTVIEHRQFKEAYYCDLALQARGQCEHVAQQEVYEQCLSLRSYYTYSRHCGYQP